MEQFHFLSEHSWIFYLLAITCVAIRNEYTTDKLNKTVYEIKTGDPRLMSIEACNDFRNACQEKQCAHLVEVKKESTDSLTRLEQNTNAAMIRIEKSSKEAIQRVESSIDKLIQHMITTHLKNGGKK